jgi:tRNA pseudouridine55 synthase
MALEGLLLVDKPALLTSHDVIRQLRRLTGIRRIGHAGTLDPLATGLLLVCVGRATRLLEYLLDQPKSYEATIRLGQRTDTFDAQGVVIAEENVDASAADIVRALEPFRGTILQRAPIYSAIKRDGKPLYKLARQGVEVDRPEREVTIYDLEMRSWEAPSLQLELSCSSGTYVRSIADDLGEALGCGGHITGLRRTAVGAFSIGAAAPLEALDSSNWKDYMLPPDTAVQHLPQVAFSAEHAQNLLLGQRVPGSGVLDDTLPARAYDPDGRFLGIVLAVEQSWQPHKMFPPQ